MEIVNAFLLFCFSYILRQFHFYEIMILYFTLIYSLVYLESIEQTSIKYLRNTISDKYNSLRSSNPTDSSVLIVFLINLVEMLYGTLKYTNDVYVYGRDKLIYYVGKGISVIFIPKGITNIAFLGMNPKKPECLKNEPIVKQSEESKVEPKTKVFKSDREMYKFLDDLNKLDHSNPTE